MIQLYSENNTDYSKNGNAVLTPLEAYTESELNGAWTATLVCPIDDQGTWQMITEQAVVKMPSWNGDQLYRIVSRSKTDYDITVTMYPIFYDSMHDCWLLDVRPTDRTGQQALNLMLVGQQAKYSAECDIIARKTAYYENKNFMEALGGEDENCFLRRWGGEVEYDNFTVRVQDHMGTDRGLYLRYGRNIQQLSEEIDMSEIVTRVYPIAYNNRRYSRGYIDSPLINSYPVVRIGTLTYDNIKAAGDASDEDEANPDVIVCHSQAELDAALLAAVDAEFENGLDKPNVSITVDGVVDMSKIAGYEQLAEPIGLGDTAHLIHDRLGITTDARIVYIKYDAIRNEVADIRIGSKPYNFFEVTASFQAQAEAGQIKTDSVVAVWFEHCQASQNVLPSGGTFEDIQITPWTETLPSYVEGRFYWMRSVTKFKSGAVMYGDPLFDMANQIAGEAQSAAASAMTAAQTAEGIADAAAAAANQKRRVFMATPTTPYDAGDLYFDGPHSKTYICTTSRESGNYSSSDWTEYATDVSAHFWYDSAGAHVSDVQGSVASGNSQTIAPGGTVMMRNGKLIASWTGSGASNAAVNFYDCSGATAAASKLIASYGARGITQYIAGLMALALTATGMSIYGVDETNQVSITEAVFGKNGVELYANNIKRLALTATNGLTFYDTDGSTVVGQFNKNEIFLFAQTSNRNNYIRMGANGVRITTENTTSGSQITNELQLNNGSFIFYQDGTSFGELKKWILEDNPMLGITSPKGIMIQMGTTNRIGIFPSGVEIKSTKRVLLESSSGYISADAKTYIAEKAGTFKQENITTYKTETIGTNRTVTVGGNSYEKVTGELRWDYGSLIANGYGALLLRTGTITTLNSNHETGIYDYSSSATGVPTSAGGTLVCLRRSANYAHQIAFPNSSSGTHRIYARLFHEGSFTAWVNLLA